MNRISTAFAALKQTNKKALIPYITAGDPQPEVTVSLLHTLVKAGANLIELGIPFSDPMAEGPVIQAAHERALSHGVTLIDVLNIVKDFRQQDAITPIILMGYMNPIEYMGYTKFAEAAKKAGVDGVLIVDLPPEEAASLQNALCAQSIDLIFLLAPTTTPQRMELICQQSGGYHYYVSLKGVTGANNLDINSVAIQLTELRKHARLPIAIGFGIQDAYSAKAAAKLADGIVVGAALIARIGQSNNLTEINHNVFDFLQELRTAIDEA